MSDTDNPSLCPGGTKHRWRELRIKLKKPGPPYEFFMRCRDCNALKVQLVDIDVRENGDRFPKITTTIWAGDIADQRA
jgi:hypothetical protein